MRPLWIFTLLPVALFPAAASAQFVYPRAADHVHEAGVYAEDPFIIKYRRKFFAVFRGDFKTFNAAYKEIEEMLEKDPRDARALVWLGNGQTVRAGLLKVQNKKIEAEKLVAESRRTLDRAVALRPNDPNIYMMRAATLYIQGQYWPVEEIPRSVWANLRLDCEKFLRFVGPARIPKLSTHVRGEAYGELGIACRMLGDKPAARKAFTTLLKTDPGTAYAGRAQKELDSLK